MKYLDRFHPSSPYHIFNHAVGSENLFRSHRDYASFLARFEKYLMPVCKPISYCLMPNHFHFEVKIRDANELLTLCKESERKDFNCHKFVMQYLSNFLNSYAKAYNSLYSRKGALFIDYTKRIEIKDDLSILSVMKYIHLNPVNHGFCNHPTDWAYSSYQEILNENLPTFIDRDLIKSYINGQRHFIEIHRVGQFFL